jgi:hypothetical protein
MQASHKRSLIIIDGNMDQVTEYVNHLCLAYIYRAKDFVV